MVTVTVERETETEIACSGKHLSPCRFAPTKYKPNVAAWSLRNKGKRTTIRSCRRCPGNSDILKCPEPCTVPYKTCLRTEGCRGVDKGRKCTVPYLGNASDQAIGSCRLLSKKTESCLIFTSDSPERPPLFFTHQNQTKPQTWPKDYEVCLTLPTTFAI
jgi:hypothetical protein